MKYEPAYWSASNYANLMTRLANSFPTAQDALYEYVKNLEEAKASIIQVDIDYKKREITVAGDGDGMDASEMDRVMHDQGGSVKGSKHHGTGIISFLRMAQKITIFSKYRNDRKQGAIYIMSAESDGKGNLMSVTGVAREVTEEERVTYPHAVGKLESKWEGGTVTLIEGVGRAAGFNFDIAQEFEEKKFLKWFRGKVAFTVDLKSYYVKAGDAVRKRLKGKTGTGKKIEIKIPSKEHSDCRHHFFEMADAANVMHRYELKTTISVCVGAANDGVIMILEDGQNAFDLKEAVRTQAVSHTTVFRNHDLLRYLTGWVNFRIIALDGGPEIPVYPQGRDKLLMANAFGDCLANQLVYADTVIKPLIENYSDDKANRKTEQYSRQLQVNLEAFLKEHPSIFNLVQTHASGQVVVHYATCDNCKNKQVPKKGSTMAHMDRSDPNAILSLEDVSKYKCLKCGYLWAKRTVHTGTEHTTPSPAHYDKSKGLTGADNVGLSDRQRTHGRGFQFFVWGLGRTDTRRGIISADTVKVNRDHPDWQAMEKRGPAARELYEWWVAMSTIIEYEVTDPSEKSAKMQELATSLIVWLPPSRRKNGSAVASPFTSIATNMQASQLVSGPSVETLKKEIAQIESGAVKLGSAWGASVTVRKAVMAS